MIQEYRIPWYQQLNRRGRWLRRHMHKRPQRLPNKIVWYLAVQQGRWITRRRH